MLKDKRNKSYESEKGFTLIELSIVLVIIGLIVGGVLVGQDLIRAAEVRATISQIEKYNTAVNTFHAKFNAIPGDMSLSIATQFGFTEGVSGTGNCSGTSAGNRNGDGVIDGGVGAASLVQNYGETGLFWVDLSSSQGGNLIDGTFATATCAAPATALSNTSTSGPLNIAMPAAKLGKGHYVYVYENNSQNFYGLSVVTAVATTGIQTSNATMTVVQAYNIDKKMDDGYPLNR